MSGTERIGAWFDDGRVVTHESLAALGARYHQYAVEQVAKIPPRLRPILERYATLSLASETGVNAVGRILTKKEKSRATTMLNSLVDNFKAESGTWMPFNYYAYGIDTIEVVDILDGKLTRQQRLDIRYTK